MPVVGVVKLGAESLLPLCNEFRLIPSDRHNLCGRAHVSIRPRTQRVLRKFARWAQHHGSERSGPRTEPEHSSSSVQALLRSEEHTSELQSHHDLVCRLLLEKKKYSRFQA